MSLLNALRAGVKVANSVTKKGKLQSTLMYSQMTSSSVSGKKIYAAAVPLLAIIEKKQRNVKSLQGEVTVSSTTVLFLDVAALIAATGGLGIQQYDKLVMPDRTTGRIMNFGGFMDSGTTLPVATEVYLG